MMDFSKDNIVSRIGRMEQLAAIKRYALEDGKGRGMRAFEVVNGSGFDFTVFPDRGLDIGPARYNGLPLTWTTRNGPVAPAFYDASGLEWLRTWGGGLLTTCGWLNVGGPCTTPEGEQGLHGRMDHTPAEEVNTRAFWNETGEYVLEITGRMVLSRGFGENLATSRTITTRLGWPGVEIVDRTENLGGSTMPLMQLYHMNFGWPLISEGTRLVAPEHKVTPRDDEAAKGVGEWDRFLPPTAGFAEQVIYHDLPADGSGLCTMRISNPAFGPDVALSFRKAELPYLVQWRMLGCGDYVMGLEPANCYAEDYNSMAKKGMLRYIEPGQTVETRIRLELED
jgi:hypothetical protein